MLELTDGIARWWRRQLALLRDPQARRDLAQDLRLVFPLALRHLKRNRGQSVSLALVICLAVGLYLVASAAMRSSIEAQGARAQPVWAPADVVLYGPNVIVQGQLRSDLSSRLGMRYSEVALVKEAQSSQGTVMVIGTKFPPALLQHLELPPELREQLLDEEGVGLFPQTWGYSLGDQVWFQWESEAGWQESLVKVIGLYEDPKGAWDAPLVARSLFTEVGEEPNAWLGFDRNPYRAERSISGRLSSSDHVLTTVSGQNILRSMSNRAMGPVRILMAMGVLLAVLGMFNLLLLSFLRRKRQLGTLKALGMESGQLGLLLLSEGTIMAASGLVLGWLLGTGMAVLAGRELHTPLELSFTSYVGAGLIAALVFILASWAPVRLCRLATVDQLLHARRVYINPNPSCTNCGRCGGF